ncbi:MAG: hypothetical protein QOE76_800 [Frankiales bacterium]|jgi:hypothetical protein|nr:hypothetical protein [Frankiales bacterium]
MTDDLEARLSAALGVRAADVLAGPAPVQAIDARAQHLGRRRALAASTSVMAVVVAVVATVFAAGHGGAPSSPGPVGVPPATVAPSVDPSPSAPTAPATSTETVTATIRTQADAVRRYLETTDLSKSAGITTSFHGQEYCGINILGRSTDRDRLFTWVVCEEYYNDAGVATLGSATSEALLVKVTGNGANTIVHGAEAPQGDAAYAANVRRVFDAKAAAEVLSGAPIKVDQSDAALAARAHADLAAGRLEQTAPGTSDRVSASSTATGSTKPHASSSIGPAGIPGMQVTGTLQMVGGPAPGLVINVPGTVVFRSSNGVTVTAQAAQDGTFTAAVPPGRYTVTGTSPNYNGNVGTCGGNTVTIPDAVPAAAVHVTCQMK